MERPRGKKALPHIPSFFNTCSAFIFAIVIIGDDRKRGMSVNVISCPLSSSQTPEMPGKGGNYNEE